ncbi:MAG: polysaccharide pyruvyl transferase family protein [Verrucomicrobiales bacterium]|nr:polysaccharide pyruvyl transferase family protein [Verrucomicrobiales bacterium]
MPVRNVVVDWGGQTLLNLGDLAMVMVAVRRLSRVFPEARIRCTSHRPDDFRRFCPQAEPLLESANQLLYWRRWLPSALTRLLPPAAALEDSFFRHYPIASLRLRARRHLRDAVMAEAANNTIQALRDADLVVAAGGGYLTDAFEGYVLRILGLLETAQHLGKPVVLLGQGLGPLTQPTLKARVGEVLRRAKYITLREGLRGPDLLRELHCTDPRIEVTGDDAIELVQDTQLPAENPGDLVGFNIRLARYAATNSEIWQDAATAVDQFARDRKTRILPCPIDCDATHGDAASVRKILSADAPLDTDECPHDPVAVIRRVGRCRLVVTGSYHAAVFALSQGVPAIGLAKSAYYQDKFDGLAAQFGRACTVVRLDQPNAARTLRERMDHGWENSQELGRESRAAADRQRASSWAAYLRLPELVKA